MEEVRELLDGEKGKFYYENGDLGWDEKDIHNKITVDSNYFEHSYNDEPAFTHFNQGKIICYKFWYNHGHQHRLTGPSYIEYGDNGEIEHKNYYINGKRLTQEQWETEVNRINLLEELF